MVAATAACTADNDYYEDDDEVIELLELGTSKNIYSLAVPYDFFFHFNFQST